MEGPAGGLAWSPGMPPVPALAEALRTKGAGLPSLKPWLRRPLRRSVRRRVSGSFTPPFETSLPEVPPPGTGDSAQALSPRRPGPDLPLPHPAGPAPLEVPLRPRPLQLHGKECGPSSRARAPPRPSSHAHPLPPVPSLLDPGDGKEKDTQGALGPLRH